MHTVIIGVGGVGGYFGGKIAYSGQKVTLLARGKHLEAIKKKGLVVKSIKGDFSVKPYQVTNNIDIVEKADVILVCTKSWQVREAARQIQPILKEDTVVIPLQNGADNVEKLEQELKTEHILGGLCKIYSKIESPGTILHFGFPPEIIFGNVFNKESEKLEKVKRIFDTAGIKNKIADDINVAIWRKFMFIAAVSGLGALTRATIGEMYSDMELRKILAMVVSEIYQVAKAKKVNLEETAVSATMDFIAGQPFDSTASTQRDILEGRPSELEDFNGYIVKEGKRLGVETPANKFVYYCLKPMEEKARK